jgi:hypothetical protein
LEGLPKLIFSRPSVRLPSAVGLLGAGSVHRLDGERDALAAADAQRDQTAPETITPHGMDKLRRQHRACGAQKSFRKKR